MLFSTKSEEHNDLFKKAKLHNNNKLDERNCIKYFGYNLLHSLRLRVATKKRTSISEFA